MAIPKDRSKSNNFHQTLELHLDCGSEVLRQIVLKKLEPSKYTLEQFLNIKGVKQCIETAKQKGHISQEQWNVLYPDPKLSEFDITLLSFLLLQPNFNLTANEKKSVKNLKKERNHMSHVPKAEMDDKKKFDNARRIIQDLAKSISQEFFQETKLAIDNLEKKEFVSFRSTLDIVRIRKEELSDMLAQGKTSGKH